MASGTIKRIQRDKGFGFIRDNSGQEYFFHRSAVQGSFDSLSEGQRVSFDEEQSFQISRAFHGSHSGPSPQRFLSSQISSTDSLMPGPSLTRPACGRALGRRL